MIFIGCIFLPILSQEVFDLLGITGSTLWSGMCLAMFFVHLAIAVKYQQAQEEYNKWLERKALHDQNHAENNIYPYE
jgi:hypothetical protein